MALRQLCRMAVSKSSMFSGSTLSTSSSSFLSLACRSCSLLPGSSLATSEAAVPTRYFFTSPVPASLDKVLQEEIEYEKENFERPEDVVTGPPKPFTLTETPGRAELVLSRDYNGEKITVTASVFQEEQDEDDEVEVEPVAAEDDENALDVDVGVVFDVEIEKGGQVLGFECQSDGSYMQILDMWLTPSDAKDDESLYAGPLFDELDENLQYEFVTFLEQRGVGAPLGGYLVNLVEDKEQREYMDWLGRVRAFAAAKGE